MVVRAQLRALRQSERKLHASDAQRQGIAADVEKIRFQVNRVFHTLDFRLSLIVLVNFFEQVFVDALIALFIDLKYLRLPLYRSVCFVADRF